MKVYRCTLTFILNSQLQLGSLRKTLKCPWSASSRWFLRSLRFFCLPSHPAHTHRHLLFQLTFADTFRIFPKRTPLTPPFSPEKYQTRHLDSVCTLNRLPATWYCGSRVSFAALESEAEMILISFEAPLYVVSAKHFQIRIHGRFYTSL